MTMRIGTYDSAGNFNQQKVKLSVSQSGALGLFTNGMMAWPLSEAEAARLDDRAALKRYVEAIGFSLEEENNA